MSEVPLYPRGIWKRRSHVLLIHLTTIRLINIRHLLQGYMYLAHKKVPPRRDLTVGLCLGPYGGP
jgi:predicted branched-subunit amino acid permease